MTADLPPELRNVAHATERRHEAERSLRILIADQRHAIRAARIAGHTTTTIAQHARLSRQRVNLATKG